MATPTAREKFFEAINESYDALLSAVEATEARGHNVSQVVLQEARKGEREVVELAQKWTGAPTSFFDNFATVVEIQARAERRALELARDALDGANEYRAQVREALERVIKANRTATDATVDALRNAFSRLRGAEEEEAEPGRRRPARLTHVPVGAKSESAESTG